MINRILITAMATLALAGSACAKLSPPTLTITAPTGNAFAIGDVMVSVEVADFSIVDKQEQPAVKGEGHLHYFMDVTAPTAPGQPAITEAGTWVSTIATSNTWHNVGGGSHTFSVELVNNDDTPLTTPVIATKTILVIPEIGVPEAVILTPRDGAQLSAGDFTINVQVANFDVVDHIGQPSVSHEGHIIYFIDLVSPSVRPIYAGVAAASYSYTWQGVNAGVHIFTIELANNDNSELSPPVVESISVYVK
jgi:hypothetical protein